MRRVHGFLSLLLIQALMMLSACSELTIDELNEEQQEQENAAATAADLPQLSRSGEESEPIRYMTCPEGLAMGDVMCGMLVLDVEQVSIPRDEGEEKRTYITLLSNREWINVPSAFAEGDDAGVAQYLADNSREANESRWSIPTKQQAMIISYLCDNLQTDMRYLCEDATYTYAAGGASITKAGKKKRYALRLVTTTYFIDEITF